jgi:hypothetical protein
MKKIVLIALVLYFCVALLFLCFAKPDPQKITILTVPQSYARVIADQTERIGIILCVNQTETFFTAAENIRSMRIADEFNELAVQVERIILMEETFIYGGESFALYRFEIGFGEIAQAKMSLSFYQATAEIQYQNDYLFSFVLGDVHLIFDDLATAGHLGLSRLYGVHQKSEQNTLTGFVIGLEKNVTSPITITGIDIYSNAGWADLASSRWIEEAIPYDADIAALIGDPTYSSIQSNKPVTDHSIVVLENGLLFVPIRYLNEFSLLSQFPIRIRYRYLDQEYDFLLDDFRFFSTDPMPEVYRDDIVKTEYSY